MRYKRYNAVRPLAAALRVLVVDDEPAVLIKPFNVAQVLRIVGEIRRRDGV